MVTWMISCPHAEGPGKVKDKVNPKITPKSLTLAANEEVKAKPKQSSDS
jgi:hypothetical protein